MKKKLFYILIGVILILAGYVGLHKTSLWSCTEFALSGFRPIAQDRSERFLGKVQENTARCRGGARAVAWLTSPWIDWQTYWATGDTRSKTSGGIFNKSHLSPNGRGIDGALLDLEYGRIELIKFNLFDNSGTYEDYVRGRHGVDGAALKTWDQLRLPPGHPAYESVGGNGPQLCQGELIRFRHLTGICNDIKNPLMGSINQPFARNVQFETTFPDLGRNELVKNRHGDRLGLLKPDPQVISRKLFTRTQTQPAQCQNGQGLPGYAPEANCDYKKAPFFNVLAAFWIQFMTHDWFSHLEEGHNQSEFMTMGCTHRTVNNREQPLTPEEIAQLGCRPDDRIDSSYVAEDNPPPTFTHNGKAYLTRAPKTTRNTVTAWWDASQMYGFDETSRQRVKRDPADAAKLLLVPVRAGAPEALGYLPVLQPDDPMNPQWVGQEATAFPDNWTIGLSFYHNVFAREHNQFVETFRQKSLPRQRRIPASVTQPDRAK